MTKYYSNQPDFSTEAPDPAYNYFSSMSDIMDNIEAAGNTVKSEGVEDLYTQKGEAALGVKKDSSIFDKSIQRIYNMLNSAKKVHSDIMQNIDNKFTRGMDDAFKSLNNVNGDKKPYESKYTKKDTIKYKQEAGPNGFEQRAYNDPQPYKLHELLDGKASPIEAAKDVYETRLQAAKAYLAQKDKLTDKEIKNLEGKSAEDIVEAYFPSQIPDYQGLKASRFQEENKDTLQKVDIGLKALAFLAAAGGVIFAPFTSGASLTLTYASGAYLFADNAYSAWTGQTMITGDRLSTEDRVWAGIDAATTLASMGSLAYLTKFGTSGPNLLKNLATLGKYADDANDVSKVFYAAATDQDPSSAIQNLVIGQVASFGVGKASNYFGGKFSRGGTPDLDVDLPGGSRPAGDLDVSSKVEQLPKMDMNNVHLSSGQDLHLKASTADAGLANLQTHPVVSMDVPKLKQVSGDNATTAVSGVKPGDVDVPKVKAVSDVEAPKVNKEQILRNIEESRLARENSGFKDFATRERYLEKVFNKLTPEERELIFNISKNAPKVEYQPDYSFDSVLSMSKNNRPNVEYVYTPEYIKAHKQQFENGAIKFQKFTPEEGGYNNGAVGNEKDHVAFVMPKEAGETLIKVTKGDPELLEDILGLHRGDLGSSPVAIEIPPESIKNPRIPSGNEDSAFDGFWKPGGQTFPGNMPEAVIDEVPWGEFTIRKLGGN